MAVIDASVMVDPFVGRDAERIKLAEDLLRLVEEESVEVVEPRLFVVEFASVLSRFLDREYVIEALESVERFRLVGEDEIFEEARDLAIETGCRAADAYYIATAKLTGSILISNDRRQVDGARKAGVEAYYLLEEGERALERLGGGISAEETNRADREMKRDLRGTIEDRAPSERGTRRRRGRRHLHKGQLR